MWIILSFSNKGHYNMELFGFGLQRRAGYIKIVLHIDFCWHLFTWIIQTFLDLLCCKKYPVLISQQVQLFRHTYIPGVEF